MPVTWLGNTGLFSPAPRVTLNMSPVESSVRLPPITTFSVEAVLAARRRRGLVAVFDFDGTLVNIARTPDAVHTTPRTGAELEAIARRADTTVGVVSGRPVDQLRRLVDAPGIWLFGLHGWEFRAPNGDPVRTWPPDALDVARRQRAILAARLGTPEGEVIEDKGPIVAVHTRIANPPRRAFVEAVVAGMAAARAGARRGTARARAAPTTRSNQRRRRAHHRGDTPQCADPLHRRRHDRRGRVRRARCRGLCGPGRRRARAPRATTRRRHTRAPCGLGTPTMSRASYAPCTSRRLVQRKNFR